MYTALFGPASATPGLGAGLHGPAHGKPRQSSVEFNLRESFASATLAAATFAARNQQHFDCGAIRFVAGFG